MLELSDPLWNKLDYAHGVGHVPAILSELAASWDDESARSLLYDDLCHQKTCYGATYAAIPHLLKIAEPEENGQQRREIAVFLGFVALCARDQQNPDQLQGMPETIEGWDRKRDCYRSLVAMSEQPARPGSEYMTANLPRYREILAMEPVSAADLEKIISIKAEFFSALPAIRALCERALLEDEDEEAAPYLLSGIAAADGLLSIARLLNFGDEGLFKCASCGQGYEFIRFDQRIAIYAEYPTGGVVRHADDKGLSDYRQGAPSRADGFLIPITEDCALDAGVAALLVLAKRTTGHRPALLLRHFAGSFVCCKCGVQGPMHSPY